MDLNYHSLIPEDFAPDSRVWVFQASRLFHLQEALAIEDLLKDFVQQWKSHGIPVKGYANLLFGQFIVFMADESATGVSGCSTDSAIRVIKQVEQQFKVSMFDRQLLAFFINNKIQTIPLVQLRHASAGGQINAETLYFNNTIQNKSEWENNWIIPAGQSWLSNKLATGTSTASR